MKTTNARHEATDHVQQLADVVCELLAEAGITYRRDESEIEFAFEHAGYEVPMVCAITKDALTCFALYMDDSDDQAWEVTLPDNSDAYAYFYGSYISEDGDTLPMVIAKLPVTGRSVEPDHLRYFLLDMIVQVWDGHRHLSHLAGQDRS